MFDVRLAVLTWQMQQVIKRSHWKYSPFISENMSTLGLSAFAWEAAAVTTQSAPAISLSAFLMVSVSSLMVCVSIWYTFCVYTFSVFRNKLISKFNSVIWPKVRSYQSALKSLFDFFFHISLVYLPMLPCCRLFYDWIPNEAVIRMPKSVAGIFRFQPNNNVDCDISQNDIPSSLLFSFVFIWKDDYGLSKIQEISFQSVKRFIGCTCTVYIFWNWLDMSKCRLELSSKSEYW